MLESYSNKLWFDYTFNR